MTITAAFNSYKRIFSKIEEFSEKRYKYLVLNFIIKNNLSFRSVTTPSY